MTGYDSKRRIALDRLDDDDIQIYAKPSIKRPIEADYTSQIAYTRALEAYCDTLAQPEQKPVAGAIYDKRGGSKSLHWPEQHSPNGDANMFDAVHLYTTPQPRPWVGLTDEELSATSKGHIVRSTYARAIEAKLKEKNFD